MGFQAISRCTGAAEITRGAITLLKNDNAHVHALGVASNLALRRALHRRIEPQLYRAIAGLDRRNTNSAQQKSHPKLADYLFLVVRGGIEPPAPGFSKTER